MVRCRPSDLDDIVEIARIIESQEKDNTSYQVRSFSRPHQPHSGETTAGNSRSHEYSQSKKPFEAANDFRKLQVQWRLETSSLDVVVGRSGFRVIGANIHVSRA